MNFKSKYRLCLYKGYFDKGLGLTNYFKYLIAFFGIATLNVKATMIIAVVYGFACFFLGWWWYRSNFVRAEAEVTNQFNLFQQEMREKFK